MFERTIQHHYQDPVDLIWIRAATKLGLTIERSAETFAAYDGKGTLTISTPDDFDADDCLAQMIFHEICHWLVAGRNGKDLEDWGLSNIDDRDLVYEHASHRVQATLSRPWGLREFMSVTTDWRPYFDALPRDPLEDGDDPAIELAREACHLARLEPFKSVLDSALAATATIADAVRDAATEDSLWSQSRPRHRLGSLLHESAEHLCGNCAWAITEAAGLVCRQHKQGESMALAKSDERACERWEPVFTIEDCGSCGACCHGGFDVLEVAADDRFRELHPELVQLNGSEYRVPRPDGRCVALDGVGTQESPYRCRHYDFRPGNCAEFEIGGEACLLARRRVGLSQG